MTSTKRSAADRDQPALTTVDLWMYGPLCEAALRQGCESHLIVFEVAKTLKRSPGANGVAIADVIAALRRLKIFRSRSHVRKLLAEGELFWTIKSGRVWLESVGSVATNIGAFGHAHMQLVSTQFLTTRAGRRAALLGVAIPVGNPVSQKQIRKRTGVHERTISRYIASGAIDATRQDADVTNAAGLSHPFQLTRQQVSSGMFVKGDRVMKRIPNVYTAKGKRIRPGTRSKQLFKARPRIVADGASTVPRMYFDSVKARNKRWRGKVVTKTVESRVPGRGVSNRSTG